MHFSTIAAIRPIRDHPKVLRGRVQWYEGKNGVSTCQAGFRLDFAASKTLDLDSAAITLPPAEVLWARKSYIMSALRPSRRKAKAR